MQASTSHAALAAAGLAAALLLAAATAPLADASDDRDREHRRGHHHAAFRLDLPPPPVIAGDVLRLRSREKLGNGQVRQLRISVGGVPVDFVRDGRRDLLAVLPPGVSGRQPLRVERVTGRRVRLLFEDTIELAAIELRTAAALQGGARYGVVFTGAVIESGTTVEAWVQTDDTTTDGTTAPVSVSGSVTSRTDSVMSFLASGAPTATRDGDALVTVSGTVDLQTGVTFGTVFDGDVATRFVGEVLIDIPVRPGDPGPQVVSVTPNPAPPGALIAITGSGFGALQNRSRVALGGHDVVTFPRVDAWSDDTLRVQLPRGVSGIFDLFVLRELVPGVPVRLTIEPPCPDVDPFTQIIGDAGNEIGHAVRQTHDCGYVVAGSTTSRPAQGTDALLVRTDARGRVTWTRSYGGAGFDEARDVVETADHGFVLVGTTDSKDLDASGSDVYVVKVDENGDEQWRRLLHLGDDDVGLAIESIEEHNSGVQVGYVVAGYTTANVARGRGTDGLIAVLDHRGRPVVTRTTGGTGDDRIDDLVQTATEGFLGAGRTDSPEFRAAGFDPYAVLVSLDGSVRWERAVGGSAADDAALSVDAGHRGTYVLTGQSGTGLTVRGDFGNGGDVLLAEVDEDGRSLRRGTVPGRGADAGTAGAFAEGDGGFLIAGLSTSPEFGVDGIDGISIKTDCEFAVRSVDPVRLALQRGSPERVLGAARTSDAGHVLAGDFVHTRAATGRSDRDVLLAKRDPVPPDVATIDTFTANNLDALQIASGDAVTLHWRVRNADRLRLQRVGALGPALEQDRAGGALVDASFTIDRFTIDDTACGDTCGDAVYRLSAITGCNVMSRNVVITVLPPTAQITADEARMIEIQSNLAQRYDLPNGTVGNVAVSIVEERCVFDACVPFERVLPTPHPNLTVVPPVSLCLTGSGIPYANLAPETGIDAFAPDIDDSFPPVLSYRPDGRLASWSYGELPFVRGDTTPPSGLPIPDDAWFGHYSGWHTGDGGMTIWGIDDFSPTNPLGMPLAPPLTCFAPPEFGGFLRLPFCGAAPPPFVPHPSAWDVHFFRDFTGQPPRTGFLSFDAGVPDPCAGVPSVPVCETGVDPLPGPGGGVSVFPAVDFTTGTFVPTSCQP